MQLSSLPKQAQSLKFQIRLPDEVWDVELSENETPTPELVEQQHKDSNKTFTTCPTYSGKVNKNVALFYIDSFTLHSAVYLENDALRLEPLAWNVKSENIPENVWILFKDSDTIENKLTCGTKGGQEFSSTPNINNRTTSLPAACKMLKVAVEFDNEFDSYVNGHYTGFGKAMAYMHQVNYIYFRDLKLQVNISWTRSWNGVSDPYNDSTLFYTVSGQFWSYWNNNMGGVDRNCTHMFTGKTLTVPIGSPDFNGEANLVNVGSGGNPYSMSDAGLSNIDPFTVAAHEIAHNLGHPGHDNDPGTNVNCGAYKYIMCSGGNKQAYFSPNSKNIISSFLDANTSLSIRIPKITAQLNFNTINTTPTNFPAGGSNFKIVNSDDYITNNTFFYSVNNGSVTFNQGSNPTYISPNGASHFTFTTRYTNTCGVFFRSVPFLVPFHARMGTPYPNPTNSFLSVDFEDKLGDLPIQVYDEKSRLIYSKSLKDIQKNDKIDFKIDLRQQPRGKYFIHLHYADGTTTQRPIILEK